MHVNLSILENGQFLPLVEDFYTIQGEGFHAGKAAYFIRLGGCDVGCFWCDAKESWNQHLYPPVPVEDIVARAVSHPAKSIVITGGEPLLYPLEPLCNLLHQNGLEIFLETSGAYPLSGNFDWICLSPKKQHPPVGNIYQKASELKVIIHELSDLEWAEENRHKVSSRCLLYLQPEWSRSAQIIPDLVDFVKKSPIWNISLQTHKYMQIP
ncbi:MAG: 7-carboxy-7-deazaguanine synthase QueE [Prevotellaceae bacterium]|jgi:organic radical activating enzyme|nr:7-carboxy-7-deazaguanine synthase QueE [Prevotellaceae bacterium]